MKKYFLFFLAFFFCLTTFGQAKKPIIMVVPSDVWCIQNKYIIEFDDMVLPDYDAAIQSDPDLLMTIGKINTMMAERGFPLKDLGAELKSIKHQAAEDLVINNKDSDAELEENPIDVLFRVAKCDIIMQLTYTINHMGPKYSITYNLQGIDAYTNKQIAGSQGTGKQSFSAEIPVLLEEAVINNMDNFCSQLMSHFNDIMINGREVKIDIRVFNNSEGLDLETEFEEKEMAEIIDDWMSENTVNHSFNKTYGSETTSKYEQVRIPLYKENGKQIDTESFVRELRKYLRKTYAIESKVMPRGLGRCILVIGEK